MLGTVAGFLKLMAASPRSAFSLRGTIRCAVERGDDPQDATMIKTVHSGGYMFTPEVNAVMTTQANA
jgi:hypothetical protein